MFNNFFGEDADKYIIRGYSFKGDTPMLDIKNALQNNVRLCTISLSKVKSDVDYRKTKERNFMQWLMDYNKYFALSK